MPLLNKLTHAFEKLKIFNSLRFRIFIIVAAVGIIPMTIIRYLMLENYMERAVNIRISDVMNQCKILGDHLISYQYQLESMTGKVNVKPELTLPSYNYLIDPSSEVINAELEQLTNLYDGRVLIMDGNFRIVKDTYGIAETRTMISEEVIRCFKGENITNYDDLNQYIEVAIPIIDTYIEETVGVMLTSVSTDSIVDTSNRLKEQTFLMEVALSVMIAVLAYFSSSLLVRPLARVTQAIGQIQEGFIEEQIEVRDCLETELITDAFNDLFGRMKKLDDSRQEFVSNVSHELKTPLTSIKVLADSLLVQENVPVELYKEFMTDIAEEIDRENKIITDLLSLVKMDKTADNLNIELTDMNILLEAILKRLKPIAEKKNIELVFESMRLVSAEIDEVKLSLALSNLVENAIKYNNVNGWVKVSLDAAHKFFTVSVEDSGIGIPEESLEHIFERFYRVDKSHSKEINGNGLGLAITRNAILMHRGAIKVRSVEREGTKFFVKIPLNYLT